MSKSSKSSTKKKVVLEFCQSLVRAVQRKKSFENLTKSSKSSTIKKLFENLSKSSKSSTKKSRFRILSKSSKSSTKKYVV